MQNSPALPPDFEWIDRERFVFRNRLAGEGRGYVSLHFCTHSDPQPEINYLVAKRRIERRRDRLYGLVGGDMARFRACQAEMRARGYAI